MDKKRIVLLIFVISFIFIFLTGCLSQRLGYGRYPFISIIPSFAGSSINIRFPSQEKRLVYNGFNIVDVNENELNVVLCFKKGEK